MCREYGPQISIHWASQSFGFWSNSQNAPLLSHQSSFTCQFELLLEMCWISTSEAKFLGHFGPQTSGLQPFFSCDQAALQMVFSVRPSVHPSLCLSHLFHHVPIIVSSWNFQELLPWSKVMSMQKVKVRDQRSRSQRSTPNLAVSGR